ncbi:MAG: bis(5'-nucleosyl)-tetraphosphatase (symmetrical) YqeK [Spirochaetes bacterium]|nr:bis(5'-nucleosyl)-tetraphosphatase (symmetrical) YqeK [Spirochaetota bacterium]
MKNFENALKKYLNKEKINHSISTAYFMKKHAKTFNINQEKAYIAGLLHDIAKQFSYDEIIKLSTSFKERNLDTINYFDFKKKHPILLHGAASSEIMITEFNIKDIDILEASNHHTTGGKNISRLSKYTFLCDYCEPFRTHRYSKKVYKILINEKNFEKAYFYTYVYLIKRLIKKHKIICHESIDGYNEALKLFKKK